MSFAVSIVFVAFISMIHEYEFQHAFPSYDRSCSFSVSYLASCFRYLPFKSTKRRVGILRMQNLSDSLPGLLLKDKLYFMGGGYTLPGNDNGLIPRMKDDPGSRGGSCK